MKSAASFVAVAAALALAATTDADAAKARDVRPVQSSATLGPAGDYPMVLGDSFVVAGVTYTPADTLNYDSVGYAQAASGAGISGEHRTLPLPSYVEVTSLESGRTILIRLTRRGPMTGSDLVSLSPDAWAQLGATPGARLPVRVRRVNPPEAERALLRSGAQAPVRMDTPPGLLAALRRKLGLAATTVAVPVPAPVVAPVAGPATVPAKALPTGPGPAAKTAPVPVASALPSTAKQERPAVKAPDAKPVPPKSVLPKTVQPKSVPASTPSKSATASAATPAPARSTTASASFVQVGAYSTRERADKVAKAVGGTVSSTGKLWRVRIGPNNGRGEADAALAKARAAGYADAKVVTAP